MPLCRSKLGVKMANVIVTLKIMPEGPQANLTEIEDEVKKKIADFAGEGETKSEVEPIAFGLKSLKILFVMDESKGATDPLEEQVKEVEGVQSVEVVDVRRAIG